MKKTLLVLSVMISCISGLQAQKTVMVGGAEMYANKTIVDNAVNSKNHTTLVAAVKAGELVDALQSAGPFTVFAPTNSAFEMLPSGTVSNLLMAENKAQLQSILKYHVVAGDISSKQLVKMIKDNNGKATIKTLTGSNLYASLDNGKVWIWDENGGKSMVTIADVKQQNGVIHVVDHVLLPKM